MKRSTHHPLTTIIPLAIVCAVLLGYQYMGATWTEPTSGPTGGNVAAPINAGTSTNSVQLVQGSLGADRLAAFDDVFIAGSGGINWQLTTSGSNFVVNRVDDTGAVIGGDEALRLEEHHSDSNDTVLVLDRNISANWYESYDGGVELWDNSPEIRFNETDQGLTNDKYKIMVDDSVFRVFVDRDDDGTGDESILQLFGGLASSTDYVEFTNQVRAVEYCDQNGNNCSSATGGGGSIITGTGQVNLGSSAGIWEVTGIPAVGSHTVRVSVDGGSSWINLFSDGTSMFTAMLSVSSNDVRWTGVQNGSGNTMAGRSTHPGISGDIIVQTPNDGSAIIIAEQKY
jgi:hypothetical protein